MAARATIPFMTAFRSAVRPTGQIGLLDSNADIRAELLQMFNRAYKIAWKLPPNNKPWEDAQLWAEITPAAGLISWDTLGDSRHFEVWSGDPRLDRTETRLPMFTDLAGIRVGEDIETVFVGWSPNVIKFDTTAWVTSTEYVVGDLRTFTTSGECYKCIVAHTSGTFPDDLDDDKWVLLPVLEIFEEFLIGYVHGTYKLESQGQEQTGLTLQNRAMDNLLEDYRQELRRNQIPD